MRIGEVEQFAAGIVAEVGPRMRHAWREAKKIEHKGVIDIVTETDREIETLVTRRIAEAFPDHRLIAEEASSGRTLSPPREGEYAWYLDPLDGTVNFAHSYPVFSLSLALARGRELQFGVVHDPTREETFVARRGGGATLNGRPIHVSQVTELEQALLSTGFPYDSRTHADYYLGYFRDLLLSAQAVRRGGSAAIDLCWVACGRLDGFWEWKLRPWDTAAGVLIVEEAGGRSSDFTGAAFDLHGLQTVASNGRVHDALVAVLARRLAAAPVPFASSHES